MKLGPNKTSSFHVIGEIFDRAYQLGSVTSAPIENVQSIVVPPGSANIVEFKLDVPGRYVLVDHALSRAERGLAGYLVVEGDARPDLFDAPPNDNASGH
jgi:nitrite reductase (NO-forming)